MCSDLASQLREGTKQSHTMAENTAYMKCFLKGVVETEPFRKLLANLYFVYRALEAELSNHRNHIVINSIYFPQLDRKANLEADLAYYYGDNWQEQITPSEAGRNYVARLHEIARSKPILLAAHAYVRYLGDLSGGQGLKNIVRSSLKLPPDLGTRFYEFDAFPNVGAIQEFKKQYRDALNSLPVNEELATQIVDEANLAFRLNCDLLHSLEPEVKAAIGEKRFEEIVGESKTGSTEDNSSENLVRTS